MAKCADFKNVEKQKKEASAAGIAALLAGDFAKSREHSDWALSLSRWQVDHVKLAGCCS